MVGVSGALMVTIFTSILPYPLSFTGVTMIFAIIEDIIPQCQRGVKIGIVAMAAIGGFILRMILCMASR